jgi:glycerol-3-phosphate O-acyltransferase
VLNFLSNLVSLNARVVLTFSPPLDLFGNRVDEQGKSLDPRGRMIDPVRYVMRDGEPVHDPQRDAEYTSELAERIVRDYRHDNVAMSTQVVGLALFRLLARKNPELDLYRLLRTGGDSPSVPASELSAETERVIQALRAQNGGPRLGAELAQRDTNAIVEDALRHFGTYHTRPAAVRRGDRVFHEDRNLLLYYGNRLRGYDAARKLA